MILTFCVAGNMMFPDGTHVEYVHLQMAGSAMRRKELTCGELWTSIIIAAYPRCL